MVKDKAQKRSIRTLLKQHLPSVVQSEVFEARGIRFVHKENKNNKSLFNKNSVSFRDGHFKKK